MRYVFGPVTSHRLGRSLGVDLIPRKTCNFSCIYCELGPARRRVGRRAPYVPAADVIGEVEAYLGRHETRPDVLTLCGSGEPTLNSELGDVVAGLKRFGVPVALLTNGSLFREPEVRRAARGADIILPSLDAADDATLRRVNRPLPGLRVADYVGGLKALRGEFAGRILLEVMLVEGVNDSPEHLERLARLCGEIAPDRVQLTTVLRPPAGGLSARPVSPRAMAAAQALFQGVLASGGCPVDVPAERGLVAGSEDIDSRGLEEELLALLSRRPATAADAALALGAAGPRVEGLLERLCREGSVERRPHRGRPFYIRRRG